MNIAYGNRQGLHFIPGHVAALEDLARRINERLPRITSFKIWYDPSEDYHRLSFEATTGDTLKSFIVSYYKVMRLEINRAVAGRWPVSLSDELIGMIGRVLPVEFQKLEGETDESGGTKAQTQR